MREEPEELDSHAKPATLLWCDFETTGLKKPSQPIQIGIIITDNDLNEIASGEWMINEWPDLHWEEGARRMHEATGLAARIEPEGLPLGLVRLTIDEMVDAHFPNGSRPMLAGNSVHFDRGLLAAFFPSIDHLHHRHYDVSSAFEVLRRTLGVTPRRSRERGLARPHTALADLRETLADLRLLREDVANKEDTSLIHEMLNARGDRPEGSAADRVKRLLAERDRLRDHWLKAEAERDGALED